MIIMHDACPLGTISDYTCNVNRGTSTRSVNRSRKGHFSLCFCRDPKPLPSPTFCRLPARQRRLGWFGFYPLIWLSGLHKHTNTDVRSEPRWALFLLSPSHQTINIKITRQTPTNKYKLSITQHIALIHARSETRPSRSSAWVDLRCQQLVLAAIWLNIPAAYIACLYGVVPASSSFARFTSNMFGGMIIDVINNLLITKED